MSQGDDHQPKTAGIKKILWRVFLFASWLMVMKPPGACFAAKTLRIGVYLYPPYIQKTTSDTYSGFCIDLLREIARKEHWELSFKEGSWNECLNRLTKGEIDLIPLMGFSRQREKQFLFSKVGLTRHHGTLIIGREKRYKSIEDLEGARIGLYLNGIFGELFSQLMADKSIPFTPVYGINYRVLVQWLKSNKIDAAVTSQTFLDANSMGLGNVVESNMFFAPIQNYMVGHIHDGVEWILAIDRNLNLFKQDKNSVYYALLKKYRIKNQFLIQPPSLIPVWMKQTILILTCFLIVLALLAILMKKEVREKSRAATRASRDLKKAFTEKNTAEKQLLDNKKTLASVIENLPGLVYRWGAFPDPEILFILPGKKGISGLAINIPSGVSGISLNSLVHPQDWPEVSATLQDRTLGHYDLVYRLRMTGQAYKWISDRGRGIQDRDKNIIGYEGLITDITRQQEAQIQLRQENKALTDSLKERYRFRNIIGKSPAMQNVFSTIISAAKVMDSVIIYGESGTGKDLVARAIHDTSARKEKPFIVVNCGAIPENLIESELFGYKKGAFTGATRDKAGLLSKADTGTLFLDEIGDISLSVQVKLLRAIEGGGYTPVGGRLTETPDIRIIAATHKDLKELVAQGTMRADFFYRLHVIPIHIPPLRERTEDIPLLIYHFIQGYPGENRPELSGNLIEAFVSYHWPGNIRELRNTLHRYLTLKRVEFLEMPDTPCRYEDAVLPNAGPAMALKDAVRLFEKRYIQSVLETHHWQRNRVADILHINRKTLFNKMKTLGISPPQ